MQSTFEITQEMVDRFVEFTGDRNAQHTDEQFARRFRFRRRVVHGMLPFSHLLLLGREHPGQRLDLKETETQFLKPAFVGDRIQIDVQTTAEGALRRYEASWHNVRTGEVLIKSTGAFRLVEAAGVRSAAAGQCAVLTPLDENILTMDELSGRAEAFSFKITTGQAQWYEREILKSEERSAGPSTLAALLLSTMVGMRLPGRYATFVSFQLGLEQPLELSVPYTLHALVEKLNPATESLSLSVSITREDTTVASGKITSLVSPPPRSLVTCAQIRQQYLDLGLRDKVALVTGSSRGIGATTAKLLAMHGCKVVVNYCKGQADAAEITADINSSGGTAIAIGCDVTDEAQVRRLFEQVMQQFGGLDILVNNAVRDAQPKSTEELQWADYLAELEVSLKGTILCCRQALPVFRQRKGGKIVNLSTIYVDNPVKGQNKYITAKSAIVGYSRALAREVAGENIQVNILAPNTTETDLLAMLPGMIVKRIAAGRPAARNLEPIEVAQAIAFLVSQWSNGMTGQKLVLNLGEPPFV